MLEIVEATVSLNDGVTVEQLMKKVTVDPENPSRVLGDLSWKLHWSRKPLVALPEDIGDLIVEGDFNLYKNNLSSLPEGIAGLTVGKDFDLRDNQGGNFQGLFDSLPGGLWSMTVGGSVFLRCTAFPPRPEGATGITREQIKTSQNRF